MTSRADIERRIALAKAATPGPWLDNEDDEAPFYIDVVCLGENCTFEDCEDERGDIHRAHLNWEGWHPADIGHITANHPQAVIELCEELLAAQEEIARLCKYMERHGIEKCLHPDGVQRRRDGSWCHLCGEVFYGRFVP